jgi:opacity protein-like surface antigen
VVGAGFPITSKLTLQGTVAYDRFSYDKSKVSSDWRGGDAEILSFSGEVKFRFVKDFDRVSPYLVGGAGVARVSTKELTLSLSSPNDLFTDPRYFDPRFYGFFLEGFTETAAMTAFGGGVDVPFTDLMQFFLEARYQISFTSGEILDELAPPALAFPESTAHWTVRGGIQFSL